MSSQTYLATTYLKVLGTDTDLARVLQQSLGERARKVLESEFIYEQDINTIFQTFANEGLPSWVLRYGEQISVGSHGPLGFAVLSSPNLHTALEVLARYSVIRSSTFKCAISHNDNRVEYLITDKIGGPIAGQWLLEVAISVAQRLIETMLAHPLGDNAVIRFATAKPDYHRALRRFYGVRCEFESIDNAISFPASWCQIPSPLSDPSTFKTNLQKCRELKLAYQGNNDIVQSTRVTLQGYFENRLLENTAPSALPTLNSLADRHNMTSRTLARKLAAQGVNYKQLLEETRRQQATELLTTTHLTIADIAYSLAYQEPANFTRAFKAWFETTPAAWRRNKS